MFKHKQYNVSKGHPRMKQKLTTTRSKRSFFIRTTLIVAALLFGVLAPLSSMTSTVLADDYDNRIKALESEMGGFQAEAARLASEAQSLKVALDSLTAQKNTIQAQVNLSQAKYDKIVSDIAANEQRLLESQDVLTSVISTMVAENETSPIEILASSTSVGDYMVRQERLSSVQSQLQSSIDQIAEIKKQLAAQKVEAERVLSDQKTQRDALAAKEAEQAQVLAATQGQEAAYQNLIGQKNSQISELRAQQAAANAANARRYSANNLTSGGSACGGYPAIWCNSPQDSLVDNWGMYNRECVSYTAWKVASTGRWMPYWGGHGNANQWPWSARQDGIPTGSEPRVGSVAIMMSGPYGHAMYVEGINGDGTIHVSQFNWIVNGQWGRYSEMDISASGLTFIYF